MTDDRQRAADLMKEHGQTFAAQAGIRLKDTPAPLYQLLVLCVLFSVRIRADMAVDAARELFEAGWRTPDAMAASTWQQRVDALGRAHYKRYDESTATALGDGAEHVKREWRGDLRRLREAADHDGRKIRESLRTVPRIGPVGAEIFCREVQGVWPELRPSLDERALRGARTIGLPADPDRLANLVDGSDLPELAAALVRATL